MHWNYVLRAIGALLFCIGLTMLFPLLFALYYRDSSQWPLVQSLLITLAAGCGLF